MPANIGRRQFVSLLGGAAASWSAVVCAQQSQMPVIGYLDPRSPETLADRLRAFRQGLKQTGYIEGENLKIEYRWARGEDVRLPALAADLVANQASVIVAISANSALAAKAATRTTPIVFMMGDDSRPFRPSRQPQPAWRQPDRRQLCQSRVGSKEHRAT